MHNETIEDLQCKGMRLIQSKTGFRFGTDAVLLADFAKDLSAKKILDLCTGNGIIPVLLAAKTKAEKICGIEIQPEAAELAKRSVVLNNLSDRVEIVEGDLKDYKNFYEKRSFDAITCNPPYMKNGSAIINENDIKTIARHEIECTLKDVVRVASELLDLNGRFFMVHRPQRLAEVLFCMKEFKIEPKKLKLIYPDEKSEPVLFLVEGLLFGNEDMRILPPLFLKDGNGGESKELKKIYGREKI